MELRLSSVMHGPSMANNLLSVRAMTKQGGSVFLVANRCEVRLGNSIVAMGQVMSWDQCELDSNSVAYVAVAYGVGTDGAARLWHRSFVHLGAANLRRVSGLVHGIVTLGETDVAAQVGSLSRPCVDGRMHSTPHHSSTSSRTKLELLHIDLVRPLPS